MPARYPGLFEQKKGGLVGQGYQIKVFFLNLGKLIFKFLYMKKYLFLFILLGDLMFPQSTFCQTTVSEAKITYGIKVDMPAGSNTHMPNMSNGKMVMYIKGNEVREDLNLGIFNYTVLMLGDGSMVTLMDMAGNKYLIRSSKAKIDSAAKKFKGITFTDLHQSKVIAGYTCKKMEGKMSDGKFFTVYYTPGILPQNNNYNSQLSGLKGLALQFNMDMNRLKMALTASNVDLSPLPSSLFVVPTSGYKEMNMSNLGNMGHH